MGKQTTPEVIYDRIEFIGATKGRRSAYAGQKFRHDFKPGAKDIALPDRTLVVTPGGTYQPADGSALLTSRLRRVKNPPRLHKRIGRDVWHVNPPKVCRFCGSRLDTHYEHRPGCPFAWSPKKSAKKNPLLTVIGAANPPHPPRRSSMQLLSVDTLKKAAAAGAGVGLATWTPGLVFGPEASKTQALIVQAGTAVVATWLVGRFWSKEAAPAVFLGVLGGALAQPIKDLAARAYGVVAGAVSGGGSSAMSRYVGNTYYQDAGTTRYFGGHSNRLLGPVPGLGRYTPVARGL
mgnify:CR=1 FL=1